MTSAPNKERDRSSSRILIEQAHSLGTRVMMLPTSYHPTPEKEEPDI